MKIVKRLRDIHVESTEKYQRLADEVRGVLKPKVEAFNWFFLSRLKLLESFALKIETGRVPDPHSLEDFFACTIVVPTVPQIAVAETLVLDIYDQGTRRPVNDQVTHKASSNFPFDDLRLYVSRRPQASGKDPDLDGLVFEVQIKTILQHAWSVATHDLIYKTDTVSWPRERIAYQVKAMLEHAEIAIAEASKLADAPFVAKMDSRTTNILGIIAQIERIWSGDQLPTGIKRLAETAFELLRVCDLPADQFTAIIDAEKRRIGLLPADLSPYSFFLQALAQKPGLDFQRLFNRGHIRTRIAIHAGMDLPIWMRAPHARITNLN